MHLPSAHAERRAQKEKEKSRKREGKEQRERDGEKSRKRELGEGRAEREAAGRETEEGQSDNKLIQRRFIQLIPYLPIGLTRLVIRSLSRTQPQSQARPTDLHKLTALRVRDTQKREVKIPISAALI